MTMDNLFFKVWKDKIIRDIIINYRNYYKGNNCHSFKSHEINSCNWMVENNHIGLLYDKVKNGEYLVFNVNATNDPHKERTIDNKSFSMFGNDNFLQSWVSNSIEFYSNLFKNYSNYFTESIDLLKSTVSMLIKYDLHIGIQVLFNKEYITSDNINEFGEIDSTEQYTGYIYLILKTITNYSINCLNFIYDDGMKFGNINSKCTSKEFEFQVWRIIFGSEKRLNGNLTPKIQYQTLEFILNKMNIKLPLHQQLQLQRNDMINIDDQQELFTCQILNLILHESTVSTLIDCCMVISLLDGEFAKPFLESLSNKSFKISVSHKEEYNNALTNELPNEILSINQLNELSNKFKQQGIPLDEPVSNVDCTNQDIKYLFKLVLPFTGFNFIMTNLSFYQIKYHQDYSICNLDWNGFKTSGISPLSFGDEFNEIAKFPIFYRGKNVSLFKYLSKKSTGSREKQIKFINDAIDYLINNDQETIKYELDINRITNYTLVRLILEIDDLELLELTVNRLSESFKLNNQEPSSLKEINRFIFPYKLFSLVKSIGTFDYCFNTIKNNDLNNNVYDNPLDAFEISIGDIENNEVSNHFQINYKDDYVIHLQRTLDQLKSPNEKRNKLTFSLVKYSVQHSGLIEIDWNVIWYAINLSTFSSTEIIWLIKNTPLNIKYSLRRYTSERIDNIIDAVYWVYENRPEDLEFKNNLLYYLDETRAIQKSKYIDARCRIDLDVYYLFHYLNSSLEIVFQNLSLPRDPNDISITPTGDLFIHSKLLFSEIIKRNDTNGIDILLRWFFKNENQSVYYKDYFYILLELASKFGCLSIFKYIIDNGYSFILYVNPISVVATNVIQHPKDNNLIPFFVYRYFHNSKKRNPTKQLEKKQLDKILEESFKNNHLDLISYFKNTILSRKVQSFNLNFPSFSK